MNVLIVDDCPTVRLRLSKDLKTWGFTPLLAENAAEALELKVRGGMPRLLIVDWVMPQVEGPELIQQIRKLDPDRNHYIIMLTGKSGRDVLETAFRCGADDYLSKPVVEEELYRRICEGKNILQRQDEVMAATLR